MNLKGILLCASVFANSCAATEIILAPPKCKGSDIIKICNDEYQGYQVSYVMHSHKKYGKVCTIQKDHMDNDKLILTDFGCDDIVDVYMHEKMWEIFKKKRPQAEEFFETKLDPLYKKIKDHIFSDD